jgi:hypothetical protein
VNALRDQHSLIPSSSSIIQLKSFDRKIDKEGVLALCSLVKSLALSRKIWPSGSFQTGFLGYSFLLWGFLPLVIFLLPCMNPSQPTLPTSFGPSQSQNLHITLLDTPHYILAPPLHFLDFDNCICQSSNCLLTYTTKMYVVGNVYVIAAVAVVGGALFGFDISSMSAIISTKAYLCYFNQGPLHLDTDGKCSGPTANVQGMLKRHLILFVSLMSTRWYYRFHAWWVLAWCFGLWLPFRYFGKKEVNSGWINYLVKLYAMATV